ncbi:hypothetical protein HMPREF0185_01468 [Brevundimonas diminuta 470-4]|nr:hypothetical protein HMPREF0185_01468 [Brevundimonas diminuta 470-4]
MWQTPDRTRRAVGNAERSPMPRQYFGELSVTAASITSSFVVRRQSAA